MTFVLLLPSKNQAIRCLEVFLSVKQVTVAQNGSHVNHKIYCKLGHFHLLLENYAKGLFPLVFLIDFASHRLFLSSVFSIALEAYQKHFAVNPEYWKVRFWSSFDLIRWPINLIPLTKHFFSLGFIILVRIRTRLLPLQCLPVVSYPFSFFNPSIPFIHSSILLFLSFILQSFYSFHSYFRTKACVFNHLPSYFLIRLRK